MSSDPVHANSSEPEAAPVPPSVAAYGDPAGDPVRLHGTAHALGASRHFVGQRSWLLASAVQRMAAAALVSVALWSLTAWAMGWW